MKIDDLSFEESNFCRGGKHWYAKTLVLFAKAKGYKPFDMPLDAFDLSDGRFELNNLRDFIFNCKRVKECSLDYPIILDDYGQVADGAHRICKAILEGKKTIKAIRLDEMPAYDWND